MTKLLLLLLAICFFTSCVQFKKLTSGIHGNGRQLNKYSNYESDSFFQKSKYIFGSSELAELKQAYALDTLVDQDDLLTIINLLEWTHAAIPYSYGFSGDASKTFSNPRNALSMLKNKDNTNMVFVCRDMATALTEIYLAVGLQARTVTCISRYINDPDAHVVTEVYCAKLNKWIMVDPSFNAYIVDANSQILNLCEIRDHLANNRALKTNSNVNVNSRAFDSHKYVKYLSQVCFAFERAVDSEFGIEAKAVKRMILFPKGYSNTAYTDSEFLQITNNAELFWE